VACGVAIVRAAAGVSLRDRAARRRTLRATALVLALVVPLIPIHASFTVPLTVLGALSLLLLGADGAARRAPQLPQRPQLPQP
jgi:hypothetical protein